MNVQRMWQMIITIHCFILLLKLLLAPICEKREIEQAELLNTILDLKCRCPKAVIYWGDSPKGITVNDRKNMSLEITKLVSILFIL